MVLGLKFSLKISVPWIGPYRNIFVLLTVDASSLQRVCAVSNASSFSGVSSIATILYRYCVSYAYEECFLLASLKNCDTSS